MFENEVTKEEAVKEMAEVDSDDEKVLCAIPDDQIHHWIELVNARNKFRHLIRQVKEQEELMGAHETLFWYKVTKDNEIVENHKARGFALGVRRNLEGEPVAVAFEDSEQDNRLPPGLADFLRRTRG